MKLSTIFLISFILFVFGALFFLQQESWIIINLPTTPVATTSQATDIKPQEVKLWLWHSHTMKQETAEIIVSTNDKATTLKHLINSWCMLLEENNITDKQIAAQSVALSPSKQEAFVCLNHPPFLPQASTYEKMMIIESLLKTIRSNITGITHIRLLINHQPLQDEHLNFDIPWPVCGQLE
jgi:hypothetical protein